jgi:hypothetical protein
MGLKKDYFTNACKKMLNIAQTVKRTTLKR